ncbi:vitamin K epoxide reductase family protein [Chryseobacterium indoltheticum]|uniref:vitamin K epoxide reductase family protein n=1 Tax=Chryseobacterium indoltheticum TaxID=254 RepID=UPI003F494BB0
MVRKHFQFIIITGIYISLELFNQKFGQESVVVSNICGGATNSNSKSSCATIFSADKTNILGLKLSDFSLIYFLGITFIGLLFPGAQFVLKIISLISVAVILYSLYVQTFVEKSLCRVCLFIIFILLAQIAVSSFYFSLVVSLPIIFISVIAFISLFFTIVFLNNLMNQKEELKKSNAKILDSKEIMICSKENF